MKGLFYGLDGGGTRCRLAIWDENKRLIYKDEGESSNVYAVGFEQAKSNVRSLLEKAAKNPLVEVSKIRALCFGSAGLARDTERSRWLSFFESQFPEPIALLLCTDAEIMLAGSLNEPTGIGLIAGTGSICIGRNEDGVVVRAGGMGTALGDEGSAWWIAKEAVRRTLRSKENRDLPTTMETTIHAFFHLESLYDCIPFFNDKSLTKSAVAEFAPFVSVAAEQGDQLALAILEEAATELASLVNSVESRLGGQFLHRITLGGGVLEHDKLIRKLFLEKLTPTLIVCPSRGTALDGAGILAFSLVQ
ncbi:putative N-acetylglucosamine kinase [Sphaerochaeta pleomorpha str. Grapes]|uniref:Putative N-acetylglucosamine kinase n=1 Tax=Sphaerochaeta pleomorpha (strain ATCC BAA-1885 / DSM 22778 / Grapes) TaxID=158190 RepID=G8QRC7_SPHPG|nr:BadF/BadG/BcrA/BcrD ATPase family protein [Sphaerochaeta pleomorpha]AEV28780.1 putative N-acetylglucosamine kinase [Sphaerochaeta pleomorpha str. Grapes]